MQFYINLQNAEQEDSWLFDSLDLEVYVDNYAQDPLAAS